MTTDTEAINASFEAERDVYAAMVAAGTAEIERQGGALVGEDAARVGRIFEAMTSMMTTPAKPGTVDRRAADVQANELVLNAALRGRAIPGLSAEERVRFNGLARVAADRAGLGRLVIASAATEVTG